MTDINDLNGDTTTVDDLNAGMDTQEYLPGMPKQSASNQAAVSALISDRPEDAVQLYSEMNHELQGGRSKLSEDILVEQQMISRIQARDALVDYISQPDVSEEHKSAGFNLLVNDAMPNWDRNVVLAEKSTSAPVPNESPERTQQRWDIFNFEIDRQEANKVRQAQMNRALAKLPSGGGAERLAEAIELFFIPGTEMWQTARIVREAGFEGIDVNLQGNMKAALKEHLENMDPEDRHVATERLLAAIEEEASILFPDENSFSQYMMIRDVIAGDYTNFDKFVDNLVSVMDVAWFGFAAARLAWPVLKGTKFIRSLRQPAAAVNSVITRNPHVASRMHDAVVADESGQTAQVLYGTSREDAVVSDIAPNVMGPPAPIDPRVHNIGSIDLLRLDPSEEVLDTVKTDPGTQFFQRERDEMVQMVTNDFSNPIGLSLRHEMSQIGRNVDDEIAINAVYGPPDGSFPKARDAILQTMLSLQKYGVSEDNLVILKEGPEGFVPLSKQELNDAVRNREEGSFLAQVQTKYEENPLDIGRFSKTDVSYNIFDPVLRPISAMRPSLTRYILDAGSMFHPKISTTSGGAVDRAAGLERAMLNEGKKFNHAFHLLPKRDRKVLDEYIQRVNEQGVSHSYLEMLGEGLTEASIGAYRQWRRFWDTHFILENRDLARTMRSRGWEVLEDGHKRSRLFAKRVSQGTPVRLSTVYDPVRDTVGNITKQQADQLYQNGGTFAAVKDPFEIDGVMITHIRVDNTRGNFLRRINDHDQVLNYREGYYQVQYKGSRFVRKFIRDEDGNVIKTRAMAVAGNTQDANLMLERLRANDPDWDGVSPWGEVTRDKFHLEDNFEDYWDMSHTGGRTATYVRGQRLQGADTHLNTGLNQRHVVSPVDSVVNSARSISRRVPMRNWLETAKQRWISQYGDLVKEGLDYPLQHTDIKANGRNQGDIADAKSSWEFINYMENGYINSVDSLMKGVFRHMADIVGKNNNIPKQIEEGFEFLGDVNRRGVTGFAKNLAFNALIAYNPARQLLVQAHQAVQLAAIEPRYVVSGLAQDNIAMMFGVMGHHKAAAKLMGVTEQEFTRIYKAFESTGMSANIDKQNLVNGALNQWADTLSHRGPASRAFSYFANFPRRAGFDLGEWINITSAYNTFRHRALKKGLDADSPIQAAKVAEAARLFTYQMNRAGDMPYNQNAAAMFMQFMQVPHKAALSMTSNRSISPREKAQLAFFNLALYGVPTGFLINNFYRAVPEDPETREIVMHGLESYAVNSLLTKMTGEETSISFKNIAPLEMHGLYEVLLGLGTEGMADVLQNSPAGHILFSGNSRLREAFRDAARFMNFVDDGVPAKDLLGVFDSFAKVASGYSNTMKALVALERGKLYSSNDSILDDSVSTPEAFALALGLPTQDMLDTIYSNMDQYGVSQDIKKDAKAWYQDAKSFLSNEDIKVDDIRFITRMMSIAFQAWGPYQQKAREEIQRLIMQDVRNGDGLWFKRQTEVMGFLTDAENRQMIINSGLPEKEQELLFEMYDQMMQDNEDMGRDERGMLHKDQREPIKIKEAG